MLARPSPPPPPPRKCRVEVDEEDTKRRRVEQAKGGEGEGDDELRKTARTFAWLRQQRSLPTRHRELFRGRPKFSEAKCFWELEMFAGEDQRGGEQEELQPEIWQRLPSALQADIVARLPLCSRIRCRCVCKLWRSPAAFVSHHHPVPCLLCVNYSHDTWSLYDPGCSQWHTLAPPLLLAQHPVRLRSADRGLVCLEQLSSANPLPVVVCNPITGRSCPLPLSPGTTSGRPRVLQIAADVLSSASYKLVRVNADTTTWVYDSTIALWEPAECMPLDQTEEAYDHTPHCNGEETYYHTVHCNGKIYALGDKRCRLWEFHIEGRAWVLTGAEMFSDWQVKCLLECGGDVFLAGLDSCMFLHGSLYVWRFDRKLKSWVEVTKLPEHLCPELKNYPRAVFNVLGTKDFVMLTAGSMEAPIKTACILAYDLRKRTWHCMAPAVSPSVPRRSQELMGVSFHPNLGAMT